MCEAGHLFYCRRLRSLGIYLPSNAATAYSVGYSLPLRNWTYLTLQSADGLRCQ